MVPRGPEPRALRLLAVRSNPLSYETCWRPLSEQHPRPLLRLLSEKSASRRKKAKKQTCIHARVRACARALCAYYALQSKPPVGFEPTTARLLSGCSAS